MGTRVTVVFEDGSPGSLSGHVELPGHQARPFQNWLELLSALDRAAAGVGPDPSAGAASGEPSQPRDRPA